MADEISLSCSLTAAKIGATVDSGQLSVTATMAGADMATSTQQIGTSAEVLAVPADVGFPAHLCIVNLDQTNYVTIYQDSGALYQIAKLMPGSGGEPGQSCLLPGIAAAPYAKANSAACQVQFTAVEV